MIFFFYFTVNEYNSLIFHLFPSFKLKSVCCMISNKMYLLLFYYNMDVIHFQ